MADSPPIANPPAAGRRGGTDARSPSRPGRRGPLGGRGQVMTRKIGMAVLALALLSLPTAARAGIVLGASVGETGVNLSTVDFNASDTSWKAYGGFRFFRFLGLQAEYLDFGNPSDTVGTPPTDVDLN